MEPGYVVREPVQPNNLVFQFGPTEAAETTVGVAIDEMKSLAESPIIVIVGNKLTATATATASKPTIKDEERSLSSEHNIEQEGTTAAANAVDRAQSKEVMMPTISSRAYRVFRSSGMIAGGVLSLGTVYSASQKSWANAVLMAVLVVLILVTLTSLKAWPQTPGDRSPAADAQ